MENGNYQQDSMAKRDGYHCGAGAAAAATATATAASMSKLTGAPFLGPLRHVYIVTDVMKASMANRSKDAVFHFPSNLKVSLSPTVKVKGEDKDGRVLESMLRNSDRTK
ncbi:hypothetical protein V6N13_099984 [Hibiscus sabdariffa]|uniref:Uncharacterized protein n=1 Tax=Hibiscus sabdariffa TaxID=183260 RepID=A0ABR2NLY5_9ROSI